MIEIVKTKYGRMLIDTNDQIIGKSLRLYGEWAEIELFTLEKFLRPGDVVVDVGANIGTHTVAFSRFVGSEGQVIAFEPNRRNYQLLNGNAALNELDNVHLYDSLIGNGGAQVLASPVRGRPGNFGSCSTKAAEATVFENQYIEATPLDAVIGETPAVIKMDIEGNELSAIRGADGLIRDCAPVLMLECNVDSPELLERVLTYDYKVYWLLGQYFNERNYNGCAGNAFGSAIHANILCVPKHVEFETNMPSLEGVEDTYQKAIERIGR